MSRSYSLNTDHAKQAEGNRITETGQYVGKFTRAEAVTSKKQTEGVEFAFESNAGQSADFLTLWTFNADGKELFGLKMLNALMTCLKARAMTATQGFVEKWDRTSGAEQKMPATVYPELMNKPIGLLLQKEEYLKADGKVGYKFNIAGCFEAATGMVASEILDKAPAAEKLAKIALNLKDKPLDTSQHQRVPAGVTGGGSIADMDDDIPF